MEETEPRLAELPSGTITFLFTDIEGSTRLERDLREGYTEVLSEHQRLLREAFDRFGGREIDTQGDSFFVVFTRARDAVAAAVEVQRSLGVTGVAGRAARACSDRHAHRRGLPRPTAIVGLAIHRAARISAAGHGGQILLSGYHA